MASPAPHSNTSLAVACALRLGDNALVLGQRLGEWVGHAPELEEEMALANFALDCVGQARMYLSYAGEAEGAGRTEDDLAFLRDGSEFANVLLVEQPNGDFARTIVRQYLYTSIYSHQLDGLAQSADVRLAEIAARARKENRYQLRHAHKWLVRLGDGTDESRARTVRAVDSLWRFTGEMLTSDGIDRQAAEQGLITAPECLRKPWEREARQTFASAGLEWPGDCWMATGGKSGRHTEHLGFLLAEMQFLQRAYPGARW